MSHFNDDQKNIIKILVIGTNHETNRDVITKYLRGNGVTTTEEKFGTKNGVSLFGSKIFSMAGGSSTTVEIHCLENTQQVRDIYQRLQTLFDTIYKVIFIYPSTISNGFNAVRDEINTWLSLFGNHKPYWYVVQDGPRKTDGQFNEVLLKDKAKECSFKKIPLSKETASTTKIWGATSSEEPASVDDIEKIFEKFLPGIGGLFGSTSSGSSKFCCF